MIVSSTKSVRTSLDAIRSGEHGLNPHRQNILNRVPNTSDWARFPVESLSVSDIAYLTAATKNEFALLRGKNVDILFHGGLKTCDFDDVLVDMLYEGKLRLVCHSHPGELTPIPSDDDIETLILIGQHESIIVSGMTGIAIKFSADGYYK